MKIIVVYYSLTSNTKFIAEVISEKIGAELLELKPEKELKNQGFTKFLWGGRQVIFREKPKLKKINKNPLEYDLIIIGTPVWAFNYTPSIRSFLSLKFKNKKIALFCCHGGSLGKTFINLRKTLSDNIILGEKDFFEPIRNQEKNKIIAEKWAEEIGLLV